MRRLISACLVVTLVFLTGLGGTAAAMSPGCPGGHCDSHAAAPDHQAQIHAHGATQTGPETADPGQCDPFLCNAVVLMTSIAPGEPTRLGQPVTARQPRLPGPTARPDTPDRPPNL